MEYILIPVVLTLCVIIWYKLYQYIKLYIRYKHVFKKMKDIDKQICASDDYHEIVTLTNQYNELKREIYG